MDVNACKMVLNKVCLMPTFTGAGVEFQKDRNINMKCSCVEKLSMVFRGESHIDFRHTLSVILTLLGGWVKRHDAKFFLNIIDFLLNGKTKKREE